LRQQPDENLGVFARRGSQSDPFKRSIQGRENKRNHRRFVTVVMAVDEEFVERAGGLQVRISRVVG